MKEKKAINVQIGNRVKAAREEAGLTQERFAELVSLAPKNVSDIERGVVGISVTALIRICETLSISSDELLFDRSGKPCAGNASAKIASRLDKLPAAQFDIASDIINKLFEAFATSGR